jgi:hypothetical protein
MKNEIKDDRTGDPNELTREDWEILNKKSIRPSDFRDVIHDGEIKHTIVSGAHSSERIFRTLLGVLLVFSGIMIGVLTAFTLVGVLIGAVFVIGGILLPFSSLGAGRRDAI